MQFSACTMFPLLGPIRIQVAEPAADIIGIQTRNLADIGEGENPAAIASRDPLLGLAEVRLSLRTSNLPMLAIIVNRILQNRHQNAFPVRDARRGDKQQRTLP